MPPGVGGARQVNINSQQSQISNNNIIYHLFFLRSYLLGSCPCLFEQIRAKFGFCTIQKEKKKKISAKNELLYHYRNSSVQKSRLSGRDWKFRSVGWSGIPLQPTGHFSATSLKILFARVDKSTGWQGLGPRRPWTLHPKIYILNPVKPRPSTQIVNPKRLTLNLNCKPWPLTVNSKL